MKVVKEIQNVYELEENSWSGGLDTVKDILDLDSKNGTDYGERLLQHLEEILPLIDEETPSETTVNDYLWFERDAIYEAIGLDENGEIPKDEDEDEEE